MVSNEDWFDDDIAKMDLDYGEKAGLQIYRNYTKSFEDHAINKFRESLSREELNVGKLRRLVTLLVSEDVRFVPVIVCAFGDEILKSAFEKALPTDVPGGVRDILSGYGPLSDLSKRIRMAFAFDILSRDLMTELDRVRKVRNRVSHDWDMKAADDLVKHPHLAEMYPIERALSERGVVTDELNVEIAIRIRVIWLAGRLTYEEAAYYGAKAARLSPTRALYENGGTSWLKAVSAICMDATLSVCKGA